MRDDAEVARILVITAHPDDVDFGMAGTVATWTDAGIEVVGRKPLHAPINVHNRRYMTAKAMRAGHKLDLDHLVIALTETADVPVAIRAAVKVP